MSVDLKLALDTVTGEALIPEDLEPSLIDTAKLLYPFLNLLNERKATGSVHEWNLLTSYGTARPVGENATGTLTRSTYSRRNAPLKTIKDKRSVSGKLQAASQKLLDAYKRELMSSIRAMAQTLEHEMFWGQARDPNALVPALAVGDPMFFTGFEQAIRTNVTEKGGTLALSDLDSMIDAIRLRGAGRDQLLFVMSPQMLSKASGLEPSKSKDLTNWEFMGGFRMKSYQGIPIYDSYLCRETQQMGAVASADSATPGGLVATKTYKYQISKVTLAGESQASAVDTHVAGIATTAIDLTWTPEADALMYRVYRSAGDGVPLYFLGSVPAFTYNADGDITGTNGAFTDTIADSGLDVKRTPYAAAEETIFLIDTVKDSYEYGSLMDLDGEPMDNLFGYLPLGRVKDSRDFLVVHHGVLALKAELWNAVLRRVKAS